MLGEKRKVTDDAQPAGMRMDSRHPADRELHVFEALIGPEHRVRHGDRPYRKKSRVRGDRAREVPRRWLGVTRQPLGARGHRWGR